MPVYMSMCMCIYIFTLGEPKGVGAFGEEVREKTGWNAISLRSVGEEAVLRLCPVESMSRLLVRVLAPGAANPHRWCDEPRDARVFTTAGESAFGAGLVNNSCHDVGNG